MQHDLQELVSLLFDAIVRNCGRAVAENNAQVIPVMIAHLTPSNDPESRLFFLAMLESALGDTSLNQGDGVESDGLYVGRIQGHGLSRTARRDDDIVQRTRGGLDPNKGVSRRI